MKSTTILQNILFLFFCSLSAQQTEIYTHQYTSYQEAITLYNNKVYQIAKQIFKQVQAQSQEEYIKDYCSWYIAKCTLNTEEENREGKMIDFVNAFVISENTVLAYNDLGNYYFLNNDFEKALKWFQKIEFEPSYRQTDDFKFRIGYSYFYQDKYFDSKHYLIQLVDHKSYGAMVYYYLGFIAYQENDYKKAYKYFKKIQDTNTLEGTLSYYQAYVEFISGNYNNAISIGLEQLSFSENKDEISQMNKIIGESFFKLEDYKSAIKHLRLYTGKWKNTDNHQMGYAYYKEKRYEDAIAYFNKIIGEKSLITQNTYYHLGECYFKSGNKIKALSAFTQASRMSFDKQIEQDAWVNRARLSYEIGNIYQDNLVVLDSFIKKYPNSPYKVEINKLLTNTLFSSNSYDKALEIADNNPYEDREIHQKLTYLKGLKLYKSKKYDEAIQYFETSTRNVIDSTYYLKSKYYIGESYYLLNKYNEALLEFKSLKTILETNNSFFKEIDYHIGYCFFKSNDFNNAIRLFTSFIKAFPLSEKTADALVRIGDCYSMKETYHKAMKSYQAAIDMNYNQLEYSIYRIAILYQYTNKVKIAEKYLLEFVSDYPNSEYVDDAYIKIAEMQSKNGRILEGINTYKAFILNISYSDLYPTVLIKQALLYKRIGEDEKAINNYKNVVNNFPKTKESIEAIGLAKALYIKNNKWKEYAKWIKEIDFDEQIDYNPEIQFFKTSKKQFIDSKKTNGLKKYLHSYPSGLYTNEVYYLLANNSENRGDITSAISYLDKIISSKNNNRFTEVALYKLGYHLYNIGSYDEVMKYMTPLLKTTKVSYYKTFASVKAAQIAYISSEYKKSEDILTELTNTEYNEILEDEIDLTFSKIYIQTNQIKRSVNLLERLIHSENSKIAAEAYYQKALYQKIQTSYIKSNKTIMTLQRKFPNQQEICGKGLFLLASNYSDVKDYFQAEFVLKNIIDTYRESQNMVEEALEKLSELKK